MSGAIHLQILTNQTMAEFIKALKRLVANRERPTIIFSDNTKTFTAAGNLINQINRDEHFKDYLAREEIRWKFNFAKATWWVQQFERMTRLTKQMLYK